MISIRYLVNEMDSALNFYQNSLGFELVERYGDAMAIVSKHNFNLWLAGPNSSAARAMPDGKLPQPGGWNRFVLRVDDIESMVKILEAQNTIFLNGIVQGPGGAQVLCQDPSGNIVELFEAR